LKKKTLFRKICVHLCSSVAKIRLGRRVWFPAPGYEIMAA